MCDKVNLMSKTFVELMDVNILLTRAMSDATYARREALKFTLTEDLASVLSEENPATVEWLGGGGGGGRRHSSSTVLCRKGEETGV